MTPTSGLSRRRLLQTGLTAAALTAVGVPTLSACSNEGRGGGGSQAADDAVQLPDHIPFEGLPADLVGENGVVDGLLRYPADPPQVTSGTPGDGQPVRALTFTNNPLPPALENNTFWQGLNDRLGAPYEVSLVPSADYADRFQTAVAGDQLPDLFSIQHTSVPSLPGLLAQRAVDLTPFLAGSAVARYPMLANIPTNTWEATVYDGKIYAVPIPRGPGLSTVLYGRQDVLEERGLDAVPDSWEAFFDFCVQASAGAVNTWALSAVPLVVLRQMFGVPNTWADEGGRLVSAYEAERQPEALEAGRRLVAEGLVHPDAFGVPQSQRKTWIANGTTPFIEDTFTAWFGFYQLELSEGFRVEIYRPPMADGGGDAPIWLGNPTSNITAISARSVDRAEALLSVLDHLAAPVGSAEQLYKIYGEEGVHHTLDGTNPVLTERGRSETFLGLQYLSEGPFTLYLGGQPGAVQQQFDIQNELVPTGLPNPALGLYSQTQSRRGTQLSTMMSDLENEILQGRQPVSAWAEGVARWKADGGDAIRDEYQLALDERVGG
ncbi:extracellular solute-binding protein [Desertihabitans aurantiacus]|uniref:extracellular solute-binding protein n=1 Tax=Desertihabitans aurantiacus TaxID=2282477 RepID=UPI000DF77255|nr:extracellular solute-binding protein [Desertihabitans aurantiacus]